ncbi:MAG: prolyl aminopeptidase [Methylococcaceae bacterium]
MKILYPQIESFNSFYLQTDSVHLVYVEQSGNPLGIPVIFLHGGPCSGTKPGHRCFFNPEKYNIILMDQRGCGQSVPFGEIEHNTTQDLIDDMERIRKQLKIKRWILFGGSWGATLTLLYAQQHPEKVLAMIIRGVFLARKKDLDWFANEGVGLIYPEKWQQLVASVSDNTSTDLVKSLYNAVFGDDELAKRRVTKAWMEWGGQVALMQDYQENEQQSHVTEKMLQQVQMELHYAKHKYFITENQILDECDTLHHIPSVIIHGRNDLVCPMEAGFSLSKHLIKARFVVLPNAGHIASGEEMIDALVNATDEILLEV